MVKLYPLWSVWVTLSHANYLSAPKSKAAHLLCLHKNFSSVRIARNFRHWVMCHVRTLQVQSRFSPAVFLAAVWLLKWQSETVDKESDVKNPEVKCFFFFAPLNMKGVSSCWVMPRLKWASSICGCVMVWKNNCAAPYKEAVCTLITLLMLFWQAAVLGREVNAS